MSPDDYFSQMEADDLKRSERRQAVLQVFRTSPLAAFPTDLLRFVAVIRNPEHYCDADLDEALTLFESFLSAEYVAL